MYFSSNKKQCTLLMLVGLKGVGKTFIGSVLEKYLDVKFLRIEPIFLEVMGVEPELQGIALEKTRIPNCVNRTRSVSTTIPHPLY